MTLSQRKQYSHVFIILAAGLLLFVIIKPWNLYFLNDDFEHIPGSGERLLVSKTFLRPVSNQILFFDKVFFDKRPAGYFLTTWLLHFACAIAAYFVSAEVIKKHVPVLAAHAPLLTALFFLFYPFHAEPLFWIIGRGAIIATLFTLMSLYFFLKKNESAAYLLISLLLFIIALFSYESIWNVVFFYFLISFFNKRNNTGKSKGEYVDAIILLLIFIAYFIVRFICLGTITGGYDKIDTNIVDIPFLLTNLAKLTARNFTPPFLNTTFSLIFFSLSLIVYTVAIAVAFTRSKVIFGLMIILWSGVISSVTTAAPLGIDTHGNESERFIYFSSFFFCFFLAMVSALPKRRIWQNSIAGFIIVSGIAGLVSYNANYRYASLVTKTTLQFVQKYPDFKKAYFVDVPGEYKGALIFRSGLPEAVKWIAGKCKYDSVIIISKTENAIRKIPFQTGEKTWEKLSKEKSLQARSDKYFLKDSFDKNITLNEKDIVFWFTDNGLYKVNKP